MARVLFAWELGRGFGHLGPYMDLVNRLQERDHEVIFAARDVVNAEKIFGRNGVRIYQSPIVIQGAGNRFPIQYNFAHLLHNLGYSDPEKLVGLLKSWRHLYDHVRPDVTIFDHSPTALLASRGYEWKRIVSGSGFLIPPEGVPMPMARYWDEYDQTQLKEEEERVLAGVNQTLALLGEEPMQCVGEIYATDEMFLLGFEEMDHYPQRTGGHYLGMFSPPDHGVAPEWPQGFRRRIFAYLHPYRTLSELLKLLAQGSFATLCYAPEVPDKLKKKFSGRNLVFSEKPVDIAKAASECNFAITNGTFGTTAAILLHGKPVLCIPDNLERVMTTRRVMQMGAGVGVAQKNTKRLKRAVIALFLRERFTRAAMAFRDKYKHLDLDWQTDQMLQIMDRVLNAETAKPADEEEASPQRSPASEESPAPIPAQTSR